MGSRFSSYTLRLLSKSSILSFAILLALAVILILLAVLQYQWSGQVSEAERERLQKSLNSAAHQFQEEFYRELVRVCTAFQLGPEGVSLQSRNQLAQQYRDWVRTASHPHLVSNLFLWESSTSGDPLLLRLNQTSVQFEVVDWPPKFEEIRQRLSERRSPDPRPPESPEVPHMAWTVAEEIPALVHPLLRFPAPIGSPQQSEPRLWGYAIVELNLDYLRGEFFPSQVQRFFGGSQDSPYQVAIVSRSQPPRIIYSPNLQGTAKDLVAGDAVVDLLEARLERPYPPWSRGESDEHKQDGNGGIRPTESELGMLRGFVRPPPRFRPPLLLPDRPEGRWQLVVKHKSGSLEAVVAASRRRNLGISFGILLLLAVSAVMVYVSTMRARNLAQLQMEFVAGVSHELRTPLAVVCSAADNLATGIVDAKDQVRQYGALIRNEASRLSRMVQQILLFTSGQAGRAQYELRAVQVAEIIDSVLANSAHMIEAASISVERQIESPLPPVLADPNALGHCLQNLVSNAVKYGGDRRWIGIRARRAEGAQGPEVQVIVEDKGLGIESTELKDIFEPFYRSKSVTAAQIHGTGLGLSLAKSVASAMGGNLSVESTPGKGSAFTLRLPALKQAEQPHQEKAG
jgi:signal transduction histidine kinase/type II secretory pathway pseudopilin PulG